MGTVRGFALDLPVPNQPLGSVEATWFRMTRKRLLLKTENEDKNSNSHQQKRGGQREVTLFFLVNDVILPKAFRRGNTS